MVKTNFVLIFFSLLLVVRKVSSAGISFVPHSRILVSLPPSKIAGFSEYFPTESEDGCFYGCLRTPWCRSVNLNLTALRNKVKGRICELLSIETENASEFIKNDVNSMHYRIQSPSGCGKCPKFHKTRTVLAKGSDKIGVTSRFGEVKTYMAFASGRYRIETGGGQGGTHNASYGTYPGIFPGGKGATMEGIFQITVRTELKIVIGKPGGNSVEIRGGRKTNLSANELGMSVEDNAGTGGGGGSFVYTSAGVLLVAAGGGGGGSSGFKGVDGQATENGAASKGRLSYSRAGGSNGNPGVCNRAGGNYHGGVGAGWNGAGCNRTQNMHGEAGGARAQGWVGGRAGNMNSGYNGGPSPGAVGGFGGGGGGSEDNGASGGGGGYSGGGSGITWNQAGGGGGSYCAGSSCKGVTGGNSGREGYVQVTYLGP